jgi:hypothetical protein
VRPIHSRMEARQQEQAAASAAAQQTAAAERAREAEVNAAMPSRWGVKRPRGDDKASLVYGGAVV